MVDTQNIQLDADTQTPDPNGTENTATRREVKPPVLTIEGEKHQCRDLSAITYNEQIQANALLDRQTELQENMREFQELDAEDDDEWGEIPDAPPEFEEAWRRFHKRVVRFGFPEAPKEQLQKLTPGEVANASSKFLNYMVAYGQSLTDAEGNDDKPTGNRKSRRASRKRSRG